MKYFLFALAVAAAVNVSAESDFEFVSSLRQVHAQSLPSDGRPLLHLNSPRAIKDAAPAFSEAEFMHWVNLTIAQGNGAAQKFDEVRDQDCASQTDACISALSDLNTVFSQLTQTIDGFNSYSAILLNSDVVSTLSDSEKQDIRHQYSLALQGLAIPVAGLDNLLNMKWGDYWTQRRIDQAQQQLYDTMNRFDDDRDTFAQRVRAIVTPFPTPAPAPAPNPVVQQTGTFSPRPE